MRITFAAEAALAEHGHQPAYVLAGEGWHPGVIGIVASRLVERHCRPCVLIALDGAGAGRGSGRSISAFDLHAALAACSAPPRPLRRAPDGGRLRHRGGRGRGLPARVRPPRGRSAHAARPAPGRARRRASRRAPRSGSTWRRSSSGSAPFGHRNPAPTLLVPAARIEHARAMGEEGQHARFTVASGGSRARAVAFRTSARSLGACAGEPRDVAVRLERNEWNGTVEPRLVLRALCEPRSGAFDRARRLARPLRAPGAAAIAAAAAEAPRQPRDLRPARGGCRRSPRRPAGERRRRAGRVCASRGAGAVGSTPRWRGSREGAPRSRRGTCSLSTPAIAEPYPACLRARSAAGPRSGDASGRAAGRRALAPRLGAGRGGGRAGGARVPQGRARRRSRACTAPCATWLRSPRRARAAALDPIASRAECALALRVLLELALVEIGDATIRVLDAAADAARGIARLPCARGGRSRR